MHTIARGSTPSLTFNLPVVAADVDALFVNIWQARQNVEFSKEDFVLVDKQAAITLTQEQTLSLAAGYETKIQMRCKDKTSKVYTSNIDKIIVTDVKKQEVI